MASMTGVSPIVLASKSPRRRSLLEGLGIPFRVVPADIDESRLAGEAPAAFATRAAEEKGRAVMDRLGRDGGTPWIVAADTIVVLGEEIFLKPRDTAEAGRMIQRLSGRRHEVITGWAVGRKGDSWRVQHESTGVWFHDLTEAEIDGYVATEEGMDKAGAYAIQGVGAFLVERVEGCYFNVVGLPVSRVVRALVDAGALPGFPNS
jgi:septum formation protein